MIRPMPAEPKEPLAQPLIDYCEEHFDCELGPPMAFFELPQKDGADPVRVIYHVYAVQGPTYADCEAWLLEHVFRPLEQRAGDEARLYWRNEDKISVEAMRDRVKVRTRLAVMSREVRQVIIEAHCHTSDGTCDRVEQ